MNNGKARNARIFKASKLAYFIHKSLIELESYKSNEHIDKKEIWRKTRNDLHELVQCFHEANAYNNCVAAEEFESSRLPLVSKIK